MPSNPSLLDMPGDFTMTFRIPEEYQRKWSEVHVEHGVLRITYLKDVDEEDC